MSNQNNCNHEVCNGQDHQTRPESIPNVPNSGSQSNNSKKSKKNH